MPPRKRPTKRSQPPARVGPETPVELASILSHLRKSGPLGDQLEKAQIWEKWPEIVGEPLWFHGKPARFRRKKLVVEVDSPVWMHNYALLKDDIISHINDLAGKELVADLHLTLAAEEEPQNPQDTAAE